MKLLYLTFARLSTPEIKALPLMILEKLQSEEYLSKELQIELLGRILLVKFQYNYTISYECTTNDIPNGWYVVKSDNKLSVMNEYKNGKQNGEDKSWDWHGRLLWSRHWKNGELTDEWIREY